MDFLGWIPGVTTTTLLAAGLWLCRNLIATRLTRSVGHEFDVKLDALRANLRETEAQLKADLRLKEAEIAALRSGALSALASRQAAIDQRRLEAVDQLWASVNALAAGRALVANMSIIKFESAAARAEHDPKVRQFFEMIGGSFDLATVDLSGAAKARPFLSPMVWAIYSAMLAVVTHTVMRLHVLKGGLGTEEFSNHEAINGLVIAALPHYAEYIDKHGPSVYTAVLDALDTRLLAEIQAMLSGADTDKASVEQAAEIIRQANVLVGGSYSRHPPQTYR